MPGDMIRATNLCNDYVAGVSALPIDNLKPPRLLRGPAIIIRLDVAIHPLLGALFPVRAEEGVVGRGREPLGAALDLAKEPIAVIAPFIVKGTVLRGALDAARGRLLDVAVCHLGVVFVLLDVQGDGGEPDCLARQPADTLQRERRVGAAREGFVLQKRLQRLVEEDGGTNLWWHRPKDCVGRVCGACLAPWLLQVGLGSR